MITAINHPYPYPYPYQYPIPIPISIPIPIPIPIPLGHDRYFKPHSPHPSNQHPNNHPDYIS